jgi:hypothetical protein
VPDAAAAAPSSFGQAGELTQQARIDLLKVQMAK